ncbi:MAG: Foldase protein PrsA [Proteobacteria bacterium]|nr:Foldase protein PrsA [Pseudomonadota bacterium]
MPENHPYLTLKLAQQLFQRAPGELDAEQRQRVDAIVARQVRMEERILATPEAAQVSVSPSALEEALAQIRCRYASEAEFLADLEKSELDPDRLAQAIACELKVAAVLDRVAGQNDDVGDTDVEIYYLVHRDRFRRPENRTLRHILVTINDTLPGSDRVSARDRIDAIGKRLVKSPGRFGEQALKHSECPTALSNGQLGTVKRGQLFAELEAVAFALSPGEISAVVESPLGFHLLQCVAVEAESLLPLESVRSAIRERIAESRRRASQKSWIARLLGEAA